MISDDPFEFCSSKLHVHHTVLPDEMEWSATDQIGKGSNNRVYECTYRGEECVFRVPRRHSDTQQRGSAVWEALHTLTASQLGVAPAVQKAWYAKHSTEEYPSGLYLITDRYEDYDRVLMTPGEADSSDEVADLVAQHLATLSQNGFFLYDLKPSNVVVGYDDEDVLDVRLIDFGRDFCEWKASSSKDRCTPVIDMVERHVAERGLPEEEASEVVAHVLFGAMLVQAAASATRFLYHDRRDHKMGAEERNKANGLARKAASFLDSMQGQNLSLLRVVLRSDPVRGVLRHYYGRRCSGTKRTLLLARGVENPQ